MVRRGWRGRLESGRRGGNGMCTAGGFESLTHCRHEANAEEPCASEELGSSEPRVEVIPAAHVHGLELVHIRVVQHHARAAVVLLGKVRLDVVGVRGTRDHCGVGGERLCA